MVATVFNLTSASSTVHYFRREGHGRGPNLPANDDGEDYYARKGDEHRKASRWRGSGAAALGLRGHVEPGEFRRVLQGYVPDTDIRLGRLRDGEHEHRPGVDITLSAPKSVSLEALLGGRGSARAMRAHEAAVRATLDYIEMRLLRTRRWSREERRSVQVNAPALVAATFRHITSRNNDPQLHTHCVVANMTRHMEQWRSAEIGLLRRSEKLIGAFYRNELAHRLRREGFALRPSMIGRVPGFEISGWPRAVLEAFSSRRRQIVNYIREKGWRYNARAAQAATLATRVRKNEPRRSELEALWRDFAEEHGLAKRTLRKIGVRHAAPPTALEIAWRALAQLEERASVFPARDALALAHTPGLYRLEEIEGAFAELRRDKHLLPAIRRGVGEAWTTARAVKAEREVRERTLANIGAVGALSEASVPGEALQGLTEGQREAVRLILESRDRVVGVQGYAGTGKTTMLRRAVSCMGERRVLGLAPSASAARTLSRETGLACRTLQWFLTRCEEVSDGVADARTLAALRERYRGAVVVVDEMSLAGTAQARALLRIADRLEVARLVLVGDSRQLRGVQAGQPFRQMQQAGLGVAEMDDIRRQKNPDLLAAVQDMVEGEPGEALERLGGNLRELPAEEIAGMAAALWLRLSPGARAGTALLVPTRALRAEVEEAVREGLEAEGALHGSSIEIETFVPLNLTRTEAGDPRNWREGDIALFNRERKNYRIRKDDACTVMEVEEDRVILAHPDGRPRHLKPGGDLRYRLDLFEAKTLTIREGERLRWTRNDRERGLVNGDRMEVLEIRGGSLLMRLSDGREMQFAPDDPQLRHLAYAYASTVHAAQGQTHDRVIAVLDSGAGPLVNQQTLYVQLSRAREEAVVLTDNREQLVETLEANTGERLTALEAIGEEVGPRAPKKRAVSGEAASAFLDGLRAERERHPETEAALRRLAEAGKALTAARAASKDAETVLAALPAVDPDDRQTLQDRLAAAEAAQEAAHEVSAAAHAVLAAADADRAPPLDDAAMEAAKTDEAGAGIRLEAYRSLERALSETEEASKRLAPAVALRDEDIDEASMARHGAAAREAAAAFDGLAAKAQAAGEASLAAGAEEQAAELGLAALHWSYKLAGRRFAVARLAERDMAPPRTVLDVERWRALRERQADARDEASAAAEAVAAVVAPVNADVGAQWRGQAGEYRKQAGALRGALAELDDLETLVRTAEAAPDDRAAWWAAAKAAETVLEDSGRMFRREAVAAAVRVQERRSAVRERYDDLTALWDGFRKGLRAEGKVAFAEEHAGTFLEVARDLLDNPDLDDGAKEELRAFLQECEELQPKVARRGAAAASQWDGILARAKAQRLRPYALPESAAVVGEMRRLATNHPEHLTPEREKAFRDIVAEHDRRRRELRQGLSEGRGRGL